MSTYDENQIIQILRALNGYSWDTSYVEFCRDLGLKQDSYAEGLFTAMGSICRSMSTMKPEYIAKLVTKRLSSQKSGSVLIPIESVTTDDLYIHLIKSLQNRRKNLSASSDQDQKLGEAIFYAQASKLWWEHSK